MNIIQDVSYINLCLVRLNLMQFHYFITVRNLSRDDQSRQPFQLPSRLSLCACVNIGHRQDEKYNGENIHSYVDA